MRFDSIETETQTVNKCRELRAGNTIRDAAVRRLDKRVLALLSRDLVATNGHYDRKCYRNYTRPEKGQPDTEEDGVDIAKRVRVVLIYEANCPCPSKRVQRITISFNQDVVYAVTNGLEKTPKHVLLPYAIKSLTGNVELIHTLNRFGHGISYSELEELEELDTALYLQKLSLVENEPAVLPLVEKTKQRSISADRYMLIFFRKYWQIMGFVTGPIGSFTGMQLLYVCPVDKDYQSQLATIRICFPKRGKVDSSALPLCDDSLMQHIRRANYQAGIWSKSLAIRDCILALFANAHFSSRSEEIRNHPTPYERVLTHLRKDHQWLKELASGKRIGLYRIKSSLGSGNFSQVCMAIHGLTKDKAAIKMIDKAKLDSKTQKMLAREILNMEKMHHPNIIRLYEVLETAVKYHLVMECACGGELFTKVTSEGRMPEPEAKLIFSQVTSAIEHLHTHSIIHRDLKAENVFYAGPNLVKLGDFGFSRYVSSLNDFLNTFCGSPPYAAPELFQDDSYVGPFVDLWALGILLYFMITAQMPFKAQNVTQLKKTIINGDYTIPAYVSQDCQDLVEALLQHNPKERISISQMKICTWMDGQSWNEAPHRGISMSKRPQDWTHDEIVARGKLRDLGINEDMLQESLARGCRDHIVGIYRIVLHRLQEGQTFVYIDELNNNSSRNNNTQFSPKDELHKGSEIPKLQDSKKIKSKTCTIL
ncbi:Serine/threonine-protein kinase NIM1 [Nymphon striatum]|nr:Serine/threonine-protein kinase NIM1 [Nymphon striatum]